MNSRALRQHGDRRGQRGQSSSSSRPVRTRCWSIRPSDDISRMIRLSPGISMLNTATGHLNRRILGDVHGEGGLAHRRPAGDHDEIAALQTGGLSSKSDQPVGRPVIGLSRWNRRSIRSTVRASKS